MSIIPEITVCSSVMDEVNMLVSVTVRFSNGTPARSQRSQLNVFNEIIWPQLSQFLLVVVSPYHLCFVDLNSFFFSIMFNFDIILGRVLLVLCVVGQEHMIVEHVFLFEDYLYLSKFLLIFLMLS